MGQRPECVRKANLEGGAVRPVVRTEGEALRAQTGTRVTLPKRTEATAAGHSRPFGTALLQQALRTLLEPIFRR